MSHNHTADLGYTFEVVPYRKGGDAEQFSFTTKTFISLDAATAELGQDTILDLINQEVSGRIGARARAKAGFNALAEVGASERASAKAELIAKLTAMYPTKVIFTEHDASSWKPNARELSLSGIQKKINAAYTSGDMEQFNFWIGQLQAAAARQQERAAV
jgi:hypothetical protein